MSKKPAPPTVTVSDEQLEALQAESLEPALSRDEVFFGDVDAERTVKQLEGDLRLAPADKVAEIQAAIADLRKTYARVQVRMLNLRASRRVIKVLAPKLAMLRDLAQDAADATEVETGLEALANIGPIVEQLADELPEILEACFEAQGLTRDWLDEHAQLPQVITAITKQIAKVGLGDILGKLSPSVGQ